MTATTQETQESELGFKDMIALLEQRIQEAKTIINTSSIPQHIHMAHTQKLKGTKISLTDISCKPTPQDSERLKLDLELVPTSAWFCNIRGICESKTWDVIRKRVYKTYNYKCGICGGVGTKHPVECHEIWEYDDNDHIMELGGLIALCPSCHAVKHMGFTQTRGDAALKHAIMHMSKVNQLSVDVCLNYIKHCDIIMAKRSQYNWQLNRYSLIQYVPELIKDDKFLALT